MAKFMVQVSVEAPDVSIAQHWLTQALEPFGGAAKIEAIEEVGVCDTVVIYTDGGCSKAGSFGAWAYIIERPGQRPVEVVGTEDETTNNRMEMTAVLRAMEAVEIGADIIIMCDSEYVIKGLTQWARNWVRNGWKTKNKEPVINQDLWVPMLKLYQLHNIKFQHVKGHSGVPGNERCDALCTQAMTDMNKQALADAPDTLEGEVPL